MEAAFVKSTVGDVLVRAMAEVAKYRPEDPIHHLSSFLRKECEAREKEQRKQEELEHYLQQQKKKQEEEEARKRAEEEEQRRREEEARAAAAAVQRPASPAEDAGAARAYAQLTSDFPSTITHFANCPRCSADHTATAAHTAATNPAHKAAELDLVLGEDAGGDSAVATVATATPEVQETYAALTRQHPSTIAMFAGVPIGGVTTDETEADTTGQPAAATESDEPQEDAKAEANQSEEEAQDVTAQEPAAEEEHMSAASAGRGGDDAAVNKPAEEGEGQTPDAEAKVAPAQLRGSENEGEHAETDATPGDSQVERAATSEGEAEQNKKHEGEATAEEAAAPGKAVSDEEDEGHVEEVEPAKLDLEQPGEDQQPAGEGETIA